PNSWQPSKDVYDILRMANIDCEFADGLVKEFILFWRDTKQLHASWNTKFLQHVKFHWAKQHQLSTAHHESKAQQSNPGSRRTKDRSLADDLSDRSWAY
ncbi:MAG: DnaT-like ssDNA-binding domain-containing protein, partial [Pseudomonadales bacterium]